ncbi:hypothetical protein [Algoriphagus sp.]|uniref:hypothetical protein n=1 Tax=Algoriphagus sp. TaxID=1872435 RepID=UPI002630331D|nr:hypothetical protein [Algoriphagus sp.]
MLHFRKMSKVILLVAISSIAISGCISDTGLDPVKDQVSMLEFDQELPLGNPLENLRMDPETLEMLSALRESTDHFHQVETALQEGHDFISECVSIPNVGGMGYHYVNFPAIFGAYDPTMPQALLYEKMKNGKMRLIGVEFVIDQETWDAEHDEPPYFGSREFDFDNAQALPFTNYQLHVWIWKHNPNGIFEKFNPTVSCPEE